MKWFYIEKKKKIMWFKNERVFLVGNQFYKIDALVFRKVERNQGCSYIYRGEIFFYNLDFVVKILIGFQFLSLFQFLFVQIQLKVYCVFKVLFKLRMIVGEKGDVCFVLKGFDYFLRNRFLQFEVCNYSLVVYGIYVEVFYFLLVIVYFESIKYFFLGDFKGWFYIIYGQVM